MSCSSSTTRGQDLISNSLRLDRSLVRRQSYHSLLLRSNLDRYSVSWCVYSLEHVQMYKVLVK